MEDLSATKRETRGFYKLSSVQRIGFGSGDLAQTSSIRRYQCTFDFYTNVFGLPLQQLP